MKKLALVLIALTLTSTSFARNKVIYGNDNRQDVYQVSNPLYRNLVRSTAGMIHKNAFSRGKSLMHYSVAGAQTLSAAMNVCPSENFANQKLAPSCSGFLIGPDILVTAGHCYQGFDRPNNICRDYKWVFDYQLNSATHDPSQNIPVENIYGCEEILSNTLTNSMDFAIIRLDRKVTDRPFLKFRREGKLANNESLVVIGNPSGLPTKIAANAFVTRNNEPTRFSASLDTFAGNSGSAVFNASTGLVEGILVMGKTDYIPKDQRDPNSCLVVNKCNQYGKSCIVEDNEYITAAGEVVTRITSIIPEIEAALR